MNLKLNCMLLLRSVNIYTKENQLLTFYYLFSYLSGLYLSIVDRIHITQPLQEKPRMTTFEGLVRLELMWVKSGFN
jgi:hypothetical protein